MSTPPWHSVETPPRLPVWRVVAAWLLTLLRRDAQPPPRPAAAQADADFVDTLPSCHGP